jgi:hypothetical protein
MAMIALLQAYQALGNDSSHLASFNLDLDSYTGDAAVAAAGAEAEAATLAAGGFQDMSAIIAAFAVRGITLSCVDGLLRVQPSVLLTSKDRLQIRTNRASLVNALRHVEVF